MQLLGMQSISALRVFILGRMGAHFLSGVAVALGWSGAWTFLLLKGIDLITPIRASREDEEKGLDLAEHGELAYEYDFTLV